MTSKEKQEKQEKQEKLREVPTNPGDVGTATFEYQRPFGGSPRQQHNENKTPPDSKDGDE